MTVPVPNWSVDLLIFIKDNCVSSFSRNFSVNEERILQFLITRNDPQRDIIIAVKNRLRSGQMRAAMYKSLVNYR